MAQLPEWQPLNEVAPPLPAEDGSGRVVALVASATSGGWAPKAALVLANEWASRGQRVMLLDGGLTAPALHKAAGLENREGLSDAVLYGASIERVAQPLPGGTGFLVTAGTPVATPAAVAESDRWGRIRRGMGDAGVTLIVYLPEGDEAAGPLLTSATDIVVLDAPGAVGPSLLAGREAEVLAVTGSTEVAPVAAPAIPLTEPALEGYGVEATSGLDDHDASMVGDHTALDADVSPDEAAPEETLAHVPVESEEIATSLRPRVESGGGGMSMILFVVLAVIAAAALGWFMVSGLG